MNFRFLSGIRIGVAGVFLAGCRLGAVEPPGFSLEDCIEIGLQRAAGLRNADRDREIAEATIRQIGAQVHPQISADAAYTRLDSLQTISFGDASIDLGSLDNYSAGLSLRQLLYSGGSVRSALQAAAQYRDLESFRYDMVRAGLIRDVRAGFADILLFEAVVAVHDQTLAQMRETLTQTERRFEQGAVSEFDVLNAQVQMQNAIPERIRAVNALAMARNAFLDLLELDAEDFVLTGELDENPPLADLDRSLASARRYRPEMGVADRQIALREAEIRVEQGNYLPAVHLTAGYAGENPPSAFDDGSGWDWRWRAGVQLSWNWLDGGLRRHTVRQKQLERDKALESRDILRRAIELEVRQAWLRARHAAEAFSVARANVTLAERSLQIAETRYANGLITRLEMTDVSLARARAHLNRLTALRDQHHAHNDLAHAIGLHAN